MILWKKQFKYIYIIKYVVQHGADINKIGYYGEIPLYNGNEKK